MAKKKNNNNRVQQTNVNETAAPAVEKAPAPAWLTSKSMLLLKLFFILAVVLFCIHYTDEKKYFDPDMEGAPQATYKRWDSFYELTREDSIDILVLGNSHANHSINPKNLSATTGTISFVMAQNGADIADAYFSLEEVLTKTTPKLCVVETFPCIAEKKKTKRENAISRMKGFSARRNFYLKMKSMPDLYEYDDYLAAWSPTVRNHEFLFRDTAQINRNILLKKKPNMRKKAAFDTIPLYLGRMARFQTGLSDSLLRVYKEKGARIVCSDTSSTNAVIQPETEYYFRKIAELCKQHDITLLFLTVPMYHKHIENYQFWHDEMAKIIDPLQVKWYDLQLENDTEAYTPACFENTYDFNQHITYHGSMITTYKLAHYIHDSLNVTFPDRLKDAHWNQLFYAQEGYFFNCLPKEQDPVRRLITKDQELNGVKVKALFYEETPQFRNMSVMVEKGKASDSRKGLRLFLRGRARGRVYENVPLHALKVNGIDPLYHDLYMVPFVKDFEPDSLMSIVWDEK